MGKEQNGELFHAPSGIVDFYQPASRFVAGPTHQDFPWMTGSKRRGAEIAKEFAEQPWMDFHGTRAIIVFNPTKPSKLSAFLCELRCSAFR
jgi:hypothetical protein